MTESEKKTVIKNIFADFGISEVGFCPFSQINGHLLDCRAKSRIPENAKTVILCLFPYKVSNQKPEFISRYAAVPDYHPIVCDYLARVAERLKEIFPDSKFECFTDNSPVPEVYSAAVAGLGVIGENGLLINRKFGSFVFIGEIVTDLYVEVQDTIPKKCIGCGECVKHCPVRLNKNDCLSALSQKKGYIDDIQAESLQKNRILWGCDICAENCPQNKNTEIAPLPEFVAGYRNKYSPDEDGEDRAYMWRGRAVIDRNFANLYKKK